MSAYDLTTLGAALYYQSRDVEAEERLRQALRTLGHPRVSYHFMGRDSDTPPMTAILRALAPTIRGR